MAMIPQCDRCEVSGVQVTKVLGKDLCKVCQRDVLAFIKMPPMHRGGVRSSLVEHALHVCRAVGVVRAEDLSMLNKEPIRKAYYRLVGLARSGRLVRQGNGAFVLPRAEAAE